MSTSPRIILASSSKYRRELLARLGFVFESISPDIDETPLGGEGATALAARLAREKAKKIAVRTPDAIVIGSDQVASFETDIIGKPGSKPRAAAQLRRFSGQEVELLTAVCVIRTETTEAVAAVVPTTVRFRSLSDSEIDAYLEVDQPFDCAGSFKAEKCGIALFESIRSDDPTALPGLPLITVVSALRSFGVKIA